MEESMRGVADRFVPRPSRQGQGIVVAEADITLQVDYYSRELQAFQKLPEAALGCPQRPFAALARRDLVLAALHSGLAAGFIQNRTPGGAHPFYVAIFG